MGLNGHEPDLIGTEGQLTANLTMTLGHTINFALFLCKQRAKPGRKPLS